MAVTTTALAFLAGGSAISSFIGGRRAAAGVEAQGKYEQAILEQNAGFAEKQAEVALEIGDQEALRHKAAIRGLIGSQRVIAGAAEIDLNSGSMADIQEETRLIGDDEERRIRNNAALQAWGFKVEAMDLRNRGKLARMGASSQASAIRSEGWNTLLTTGAQIGSMYYTPGMSAGEKYSSNYSGMTILNGRPIAIPRGSR
jgi:hypothetical protein